MISGFWDPWEPLFMDWTIQNHFKTPKTFMGTFIKQTSFYIHQRFGNPIFDLRERGGPYKMNRMGTPNMHELKHILGGSKAIDVNGRFPKSGEIRWWSLDKSLRS